MATKSAFFAALLALLLGLTACESDSPRSSGSPRAESPEPSPAESAAAEMKYDTCTNTFSGYQIDYPESWTISTGVDACRWADPDPFVVAPASEGPSTAIIVFDNPDSFETVVNGTFDELFYKTNLREDTTVAGHKAVRFDVTSTGDGLDNPGTPSYGYVIEKDGKGFVVSTEGLPGDTGYEEDKKALDTAVKTLKFIPAKTS